MVGPLRQAHPAPLDGCHHRALAGGLRLGGGAQLVDLRPREGQGPLDARPLQVGQARLLQAVESLALREKLQTASYKAKIEKWDSSSDSDESDDGDLKM